MPLPRPAPHQIRTALTHIIRGACYGLGTGTIGLAFLWLQQHLR
jgi:hypothetical protein